MKSLFVFTFASLTIALLAPTDASAEIFELANSYDIIGEYSDDIETADFNNDGLEDFIVLTDSTFSVPYIGGIGWYEVFLSNGDCSFTRLGSVSVDTSDIGQLLTGDFNEDSNEDMLLMSFEDTWLYLGDGTGSFILDEIFSWSLCNGCIGDVNNDDHLDVVGITINAWNYPLSDSCIVMLGDGAGGFIEGWVYDEYPPGSTMGYSLSQIAYFDNPDTIIDLCLVCGSYGTYGGILVFQGAGDGSFIDPQYFDIEYLWSDGPYCCTSGDFNEDDFIDIAVAGNAGMSTYSTFIFLNQQDGTFEDTGYGYFTGACLIEKLATADLDLDGHLDLSLGGSIAGYGDGTFNDTEYLSAGPGLNFEFADFDLDSDLDYILTTNMASDNKVVVSRNTTITEGCEGESPGTITDLVLNVSPNPFSSYVSIEVSEYSVGSGNLQIFDLSGRLIRELEPVVGDEEAVFLWDGISSGGSDLPSGIYTARLNSGIYTTSVTLLKLE